MCEDNEPDFQDSGPWCRHAVVEFPDCTEVCSTCGHSCNDHPNYANAGCKVEGCNCSQYKDEEFP